MTHDEGDDEKFLLKPIGAIHSPYRPGGFAPEQPLEREEGECVVELFAEYAAALQDLARFSHVYLIYYLHEGAPGWAPTARPPWAEGREVGLFASRSPRRPNRLGLSIARVRRIEGNKIFTNLLDVYDHTPLLDLKPYLKGLDAKDDANNGWIDDFPDPAHLLVHLRGRPHDHDHGHDRVVGHDEFHLPSQEPRLAGRRRPNKDHGGKK